ncbi:DUF3833 family protein [Sphingomonas morindae]|uniref:DUF3833 domain-containing protein n=1 Tax=Sphingomonas morindae TaxID=1541170 RepID=A0ABY4X7B8_9SPHN|nr:DUF3833 family protein [Sphingomonas morindae]USI72754.1 DUF3833 domain-containing protein [Sphingomonas morindae]
MILRSLPAAALLALAGCAPHEPLPALHSPAPLFDPTRFFAGASRGEAELHILFHAPRAVRVESRGHWQDGTLFLLDQRIRAAGSPARDRQWRLRRTDARHFTGTLSDAAGPVRAEVDGNRLTIAFKMPHGLSARQYLYLAADGRSAENRMIVRKWGVTVATLDEHIRRD